MIYIVGRTTKKFVWVVSKKINIKQNEFLKTSNGNILKILDVYRYGKVDENSFEKDLNLFLDIKSIFKGDLENFFIGLAKLEDNLEYPLKPLTELEIVNFEDIKDRVILSKKEDSFILGEIEGSKEAYKTIDTNFENLFRMFKRKQNQIPFLLDYKKLFNYPHIGIFGNSGSGKTHAFKVFLEEIMKKNIPGIIIDPHNEFDFIDKNDNFEDSYDTFEIGKDIGIDFSNLSSFQIIDFLNFISPLSENMVMVINLLHEKNEGFVSFSEKLKIVKNLKEREEMNILKIKDLTGKKKEYYNKYVVKISSSKTLLALIARIHSLENTGIFFNNTNEIERSILDNKIAVIRGNTKLVSMFLTFFSKKIYNMRKNYVNKNSTKYIPPFFIGIDEAQNYIPNNEIYNPTKSIIKQISQEGRKFGAFLIISSQRPSNVEKTVVSQISNKIIMKINNEKDLETIKKESDLTSEQLKQLTFLNAGEAFISSGIIGKNELIFFRDTETKKKIGKNPFDEMNEKAQYIPKGIMNAILSFESFTLGNIDEVIRKIFKETGENLEESDVLKYADSLVNKNYLKEDKAMSAFGLKAYKRI